MRRISSFSLGTLAALLIVVGVVSVSGVHALFTRSTVERTVTKVVSDPAVDELLAREITKKAVTAIGEPSLQPELGRRITAMLASPTVQTDVTDAAMSTYDLLVEGGSSPVIFNLPKQAAQVRREVKSISPPLADRLPPAATMLQFKLFDRSKVPPLYRAIQRIKHAVWWVLLAGILVLAFAVVLGTSRLILVTWVAGVVVAVLIAATVVLQAITDRVVKGVRDPAVRSVTHVASDSFLAEIRHLTNIVLIVAIVALVAGIAAVVGRRVLRRRGA
jgi:hypothetical protein